SGQRNPELVSDSAPSVCVVDVPGEVTVPVVEVVEVIESESSPVPDVDDPPSSVPPALVVSTVPGSLKHAPPSTAIERHAQRSAGRRSGILVILAIRVPGAPDSMVAESRRLRAGFWEV